MDNPTAAPTRIRIGQTDIVLPNAKTKILEVGDRFIVFFSAVGLPIAKRRRNAWCFDKDGRYLWEIQAAPYEGDLSNSWNYAEPQGDELWLFSFRDDRYYYLLDPETGHVFTPPWQRLSDEPDRE